MDDQNTRWFLAGLATTGVIGTGVLSSIASFKVADMQIWHLPLKEQIKRSWKYYIPAALVGLGSIGCILGGNIMADHMEAGLMMLAGAYAQNRERLNDVFHNERSIPKKRPVVRFEQLWCDLTRGDDDCYFSADLIDFILAYAEVNRLLQVNQSVSYAEFYRLLGLKPPPTTEDKGWSIGAGVVYGYEWIDIDKSTITMDDGLECTVIEFVHPPTYDYLDYTADEAVWQGWDNSRNDQLLLWKRF